MAALHNALIGAVDGAPPEIEPMAPPAGEQDQPYLVRHQIAGKVGLAALRCALPDGEDTMDILQAAALLVAEVLTNAMKPEHADACIAEFEQAVRSQVSLRLIADVAGHA
ncbi:hypothetical protein [Zavarzinia sp.]|uniref:hypothetical protein n=1 Tax=Zavarzinia sp. TaxID=2027920 RepID=UPI003BB5F6A8